MFSRCLGRENAQGRTYVNGPGGDDNRLLVAGSLNYITGPRNRILGVCVCVCVERKIPV